MFVALIFWYQFYCGFSGSAMIDQWYLIFFNLMFSAFPQLITGTLDKDVSAETLQQLPQLYVNGQNSEVWLTAKYIMHHYWSMLVHSLHNEQWCWCCVFNLANLDQSIYWVEYWLSYLYKLTLKTACGSNCNILSQLGFYSLTKAQPEFFHNQPAKINQTFYLFIFTKRTSCKYVLSYRKNKPPFLFLLPYVNKYPMYYI